MFYILKLVSDTSLASSPMTFWTAFSNILAAVMPARSLLAPVITILPVEKIRPVVLGSRMRITTAEKRPGLYSAFLHHYASFWRSIWLFRSAVATMFCSVGGVSCVRFGICCGMWTVSYLTSRGYDGRSYATGGWYTTNSVGAFTVTLISAGGSSIGSSATTVGSGFVNFLAGSRRCMVCSIGYSVSLATVLAVRFSGDFEIGFEVGFEVGLVDGLSSLVFGLAVGFSVTFSIVFWIGLACLTGGGFFWGYFWIKKERYGSVRLIRKWVLLNTSKQLEWKTVCHYWLILKVTDYVVIVFEFWA